MDLVLRAKQRRIPVKAIHNGTLVCEYLCSYLIVASIMNAIGCTGLQLYSFGQTVSIVFFTETWKPDSFYDKIKVNRQNGMHTLCLLGACLCARYL